LPLIVVDLSPVRDDEDLSGKEASGLADESDDLGGGAGG
jgi:hypothetical protein